MNAPSLNDKRTPTPSAIAEAAAWLARLKQPERSREVEDAFRHWLSEKQENAVAFELTQEAWDTHAPLARRVARPRVDWKPRRSWHANRFVRALIAAALLICLIALPLLRGPSLNTAIGERLTHTLPDGSRVTLNTDSRLELAYTRTERRVRLSHGEALFEVAKDPEHPFIVVAGNHAVRALGTSFVVRNDREWAVTLLEGQVRVEDMQSANKPERFSALTVSTPGQRVTLNESTAPRLEVTALDRVTAWRQGEVRLDNTPLADAVAEMNRYSPSKLTIEDPLLGAIRVTGVFRTGDSTSFARAVSHAYGLQIEASSRQIRLLPPVANPAQ